MTKRRKPMTDDWIKARWWFHRTGYWKLIEEPNQIAEVEHVLDGLSPRLTLAFILMPRRRARDGRSILLTAPDEVGVLKAKPEPQPPSQITNFIQHSCRKRWRLRRAKQRAAALLTSPGHWLERYRVAEVRDYGKTVLFRPKRRK